MKLYKCRVCGDEVASDAYPGTYPDLSESKCVEDFFIKIVLDEQKMNGDNELVSMAEWREMSDEQKQEYPDSAYALTAVYGLTEQKLPSMKSYVMNLKKYMQNTMKTLPEGKGPQKAAIKKFAKMMGAKAADAVVKVPFFKRLNDDKDNLTFFTTNLAGMLGNKDADNKTIKGTEAKAPVVICHYQSDAWTEEKGTPAHFYIWAPGLIDESC